MTITFYALLLGPLGPIRVFEKVTTRKQSTRY